jgi:hypothetical protein
MGINGFAQKENSENEVPKGKWKVNKEYDNQGNLIAYDSVYVWSSGNLKDFNFNFLNKDSLGVDFGSYFKNLQLPNWDFENEFNNYFNNDSIDSLFNKNLFEKKFKFDSFDFEKEFESLKQKMDSLQQEFKNYYKSNIIAPRKENDNKP